MNILLDGVKHIETDIKRLARARMTRAMPR